MAAGFEFKDSKDMSDNRKNVLQPTGLSLIAMCLTAYLNGEVMKITSMVFNVALLCHLNSGCVYILLLGL